MKANRKFKEENNAVSAVIGVILMVAITVAIAATVYVYVSGIVTEPSTTAPNIQFQKDEDADRLEVITSESGVQWNHFAVKCSNATYFKINGEISGDGQVFTADQKLDVDSSTWGSSWSAAVEASDYLDIEDVGLLIVYKKG